MRDAYRSPPWQVEVAANRGIPIVRDDGVRTSVAKELVLSGFLAIPGVTFGLLT